MPLIYTVVAAEPVLVYEIAAAPKRHPTVRGRSAVRCGKNSTDL